MWPETRSAHNARKEMNVLDTHITVAIDGPSGAGKSTIARAAARRFGLIYVDTGAIYRTVGLAGERAGIDCADTAAVQALLPGLKIFLSASAECRAQRRYRQLQEKGIQEPYADVLRELEQRDYDDTHRAVAPLKAAPDAVHIDTSDLTLDESIDAVCAAIRARFGLEAET